MRIATLDTKGAIKIYNLERKSNSEDQLTRLEINYKCTIDTTGQDTITQIVWSKTTDKWILATGKDLIACIYDVNDKTSLCKLQISMGTNDTYLHTASFSYNDEKVFGLTSDG